MCLIKFLWRFALACQVDQASCCLLATLLFLSQPLFFLACFPRLFQDLSLPLLFFRSFLLLCSLDNLTCTLLFCHFLFHLSIHLPFQCPFLSFSSLLLLQLLPGLVFFEHFNRIIPRQAWWKFPSCTSSSSFLFVERLPSSFLFELQECTRWHARC